MVIGRSCRNQQGNRSRKANARKCLPLDPVTRIMLEGEAQAMSCA